jgi:methionyl-tRNA synthetase
MAPRDRILVTTALPYADGPIHLGHLAGCYLPADIYVRYQRMKGTDIIHIGGTDEHGVPITVVAEKEGTTPQAIVDRYYEDIRESFTGFGIAFDNFSRTSRPIHHRNAQRFFLRLLERGHIRQETQEQFYCPRCLRFLADRYIEGDCPHCQKPGARGDQCEACGRWLEPTQLLKPACKICGSAPEIRQTSHWFFLLSRFQKQLEDWMAAKVDWKDNVKSFCQGWFKEGLEDRAITRDLGWGVRVPLPEGQDKVLYVWFEALIGYISSTMEWAEGRGDPDAWRKYWCDQGTTLVHFLAKDNIVFHALVWPAMLMGHGDYVFPAQIPANEFLNIEGAKLSKSRNWAIWLPEYLRSFPPDALRYYLTVNSPETSDSDFTWRDFQNRHNSELADIVGNFVNRTLAFIERYYQGEIPARGPLQSRDEAFVSVFREAPARIGEQLERFQFRRALSLFVDLAREGNRYYNDREPWRTRTEAPQTCATALHVCAHMIRCIAILGSPFLPFSAQKIWEMLGEQGKVEEVPWDRAGAGGLSSPGKIGPVQILYPKIEDSQIALQVAELRKSTPPAPREETAVEAEASEVIAIDDFKRIDLRTARVLAAERVPGADKLLRLTVAVGEETRQIIAGIAQYYRPEELRDKDIVIVANLKPTRIRGLESQGMLLAATEGDALSLLTLDRSLPSNSRVS